MYNMHFEEMYNWQSCSLRSSFGQPSYLTYQRVIISDVILVDT